MCIRDSLRINRYCSKADFPVFKMAAVRHLGFLKFGNFNFLSGSEAKCDSLDQISQRSVEQIRRYGLFSIFQDGGRAPSWIFKCWKFQLQVPFAGPICVIVPNFAEIGRTVPEIWPIFDFFIWRPSAILDLFYACWDHPRRVFGGLCHCAKFGCNRCSNFDSIQILIFCTLSLKMPIFTPPKLGFFGDFTPKMGNSINETRKRHILGGNTLYDV